MVSKKKVYLAHRIVDYTKRGYILCSYIILCSSDVYKNMKNINFGEFINLDCSTNLKHNLKQMYIYFIIKKIKKNLRMYTFIF